MKTYIFETITTMKEYNCRKWWIDGNVVTKKTIEADSLKEALAIYANMVEEKHYIKISPSALKNKKAMYIDTKEGAKQVGYVITAKADFEMSNYRWVEQYIDLWVNVVTVTNTDFEEGLTNDGSI